jgi:hypothetical protein
MCGPLMWEVSVGCTKWDSSHTYLTEIMQSIKYGYVFRIEGDKDIPKPTGCSSNFCGKHVPFPWVPAQQRSGDHSPYTSHISPWPS